MVDGSIASTASDVPRLTPSRLEQVSPPLIWPVDPTAYALTASERRRQDPQAPSNDALCAEMGRRLLLAQFEFSHWVLRRVEKVSFVSDRRIARRSSIEFRIRDDAPILVDSDEDAEVDESGSGSTGATSEQGRRKREYWLVPLSVMRRRTLVGLDLRDESGASLKMLGLRFTQKLDESMLRAAAMVGDATPNGSLPAGLDAYVRSVISGNFDEVKQAKQDYHEWQQAKEAGDFRDLPPRIAELHRYFDNMLFATVLERMWHNFTLYAMLPKEEGRHRLLQLAFEEQVAWDYQVASLVPPNHRAGNNARDVLAYLPMQPVGWKDAWRERLGFKTTRVRLLTPSAENCASYHFEFTAPTGLGISEAALLAGRPNDQQGQSTSKPSWDRVVNPGQTVGLHAVEIPNGSLCRAQVDLRIPRRGWLSTLLVSVLAITVVMGTVAYHALRIGEQGEWTVAQVTNIVLLLVTVTAGAATYVAQHHAGDVVARMVSGLRFLGTAALVIPSMAVILLVYLRGEPEARFKPRILGLLLVLTLLCAMAAASLIRAWFLTRRDEKRRGRPSPWDMSRIEGPVVRPPARSQRRLKTLSGPGGRGTTDEVPNEPLALPDVSFDAWVRELGFAEKAIGVASAEGWHEVYGWNDQRQATALRMMGRIEDPQANPTRCACRHVVSH
jgi:hypothetical protein